MKTKKPRKLCPGGAPGGVSKALRKLRRLAIYSAPAIAAFQGEALAQGSPPFAGPRVGPALPALGLVALGAGLATAGAYKLLKSNRKRSADKRSDRQTPDR